MMMIKSPGCQEFPPTSQPTEWFSCVLLQPPCKLPALMPVGGSAISWPTLLEANGASSFQGGHSKQRRSHVVHVSFLPTWLWTLLALMNVNGTWPGDGIETGSFHTDRRKSEGKMRWGGVDSREASGSLKSS